MGPKATGRELEARRGQPAYLESAAKYLPLLEQHENERVEEPESEPNDTRRSGRRA